jgi:hypothetical protein
LCVHRLGIQGIENKKADDSPQIEHPPGTSAVMRDVSARHIASDQYCVDIMWTDGGVKHRSPSTGAYDLKIPRTSRECAAQAGEDDGGAKQGESDQALCSHNFYPNFLYPSSKPAMA